MAITSLELPLEKKVLKKHEPKSPYLSSNKVQVLSRMTNKKIVQRKTLDYVSSFPLAVNIYKASSDELKSIKRANKKNKKSVLTLPNEPTRRPQICTVSDINDSEYYSQSTDTKPRLKKRVAIKNVRKPPAYKNKDSVFYDRDARYYSQFDINLDNSSLDLTKKYRGNGKRPANLTLQKGFKSSSRNESDGNEDALKPHSVWAVLRSMNRFPFHSSPPMSDDGIACVKKKKKTKKKRGNCEDTRVFETCHTEEIAYISSYEVDRNSCSISQSSSFDRVTVINKEDGFSKICKDFDVGVQKKSILNDSENKYLRINKKKNKKKARKSSVRTLSALVPNESSAELLQSKSIETQDKETFDYIPINTHVPRDDVCSSLATSNNKPENNTECRINIGKDSFIDSDNSGSSKTELAAADVSHNFKGQYGCTQLKGTTKVNFGRCCESTVKPIPIKQSEIPKRKPRLVTTMPSACMMPKLTQAEIKRRLANIRFPIVILGKDQVNSNLEVHDYEHPQFNGLDKQIWPFMIKWNRKEHLNEEAVTKSNIEPKIDNNRLNRKYHNFDPNSNQLTKNSNEALKLSDYKSKKQMNNKGHANKHKIQLKRSVLYPEIMNEFQKSKNQRSMTRLKNKMLNLLYDKISSGQIVNDNSDTNTIKPSYAKSHEEHIEGSVNCSFMVETDVTPDINLKPTFNKHCRSSRRSPVNHVTEETSPVRSIFTSQTMSPIKSFVSDKWSSDRTSPKQKLHQKVWRLPWEKAKLANDFIESVIKKIRNGIYFNQEHMNRDIKYANRSADIAMQTENNDVIEKMNLNLSPKIKIIKKQDITGTTIPGFDASFPGLEITTLNVNQIAIKHCVRNVMMHFDVTVPPETNKMGLKTIMSPPLIPIEVTESHTIIFKCKTTILNGMLPAEICSIIPKLMKLIDPDIKSLRQLCPDLIDKNQSSLSKISELSQNVTNQLTPFLTKTPLLRYFSPLASSSKDGNKLIGIDLGEISLNKYKVTKQKIKEYIKCNSKKKYSCLDLNSLSRVTLQFTNKDLNNLRLFLPKFVHPKQSWLTPYPLQLNLPVVSPNQYSTSSSLELYMPKNKSLVPAFKPYNLVNAIMNILNKTQVPGFTLVIKCNKNMLKIHYDRKYLNIHMKVADNEIMDRKISIMISSLKINSLAFIEDSKKCIENINRSNSYNSGNKHSTAESKLHKKKNKRKSFHRLYRKCKSARNFNLPVTEKCVRTQLNKIQNLEDFFQILGSNKSLVSVFDGYAERKILSAVSEMGNWITDINPKQAMLLLLLTNKKDTPNLVRLRPILLQGIAVNRITRATELDMEIEVIEKEHLNKFSQYEGISYLPVQENHDQLLEELYWIAKTTASDYQKPFDENSEKLLKSLLEKRKKLNPSYLRVMARYVGLGLLKSSSKK